MDYSEFKILIKDSNSIVVTRPSGINYEGDVRADLLTKATVNIFTQWLAEDKIKTRQEFVVLGSYLFNMLFDDEVKKQFKKAYDNLENDLSAGLRLVLEFESNAHDLAVLPWEYIYYPDSKEGKGFFIGAENQLVLARHVPMKLKNLQPNPKPLRILIVVSTPARDEDGSGLGIVDPKSVIKAIEELQTRSCESIQIDKLEQKTKIDLTKFLQEQSAPYHVLHFIGHGKYEKGSGFLALVSAKDPKVAAWIKDDDFADCFHKREPRLIFLHACEGARSDSYDTFQGVALKLVYSRVPAVVAMQYNVNNSVATRFANKFYQSLSEGKSIDIAVQDGRSVLGMYLDENKNFCNRAFGSPVVYLQSREGIIIAEAPPQPPVQPTTMAIQNSSLPRKVPCPYPQCDGTVIPGRNYCITCHQLLMQCPKCGLVIPKGLKFCDNCGPIDIEPKVVRDEVEAVKHIDQPDKSLSMYNINNVPSEATATKGLDKPKSKK